MPVAVRSWYGSSAAERPAASSRPANRRESNCRAQSRASSIKAPSRRRGKRGNKLAKQMSGWRCHLRPHPSTHMPLAAGASFFPLPNGMPSSRITKPCATVESRPARAGGEGAGWGQSGWHSPGAWGAQQAPPRQCYDKTKTFLNKLRWDVACCRPRLRLGPR